jgi:L-lactate dehydrogenase (cytochrome)
MVSSNASFSPRDIMEAADTTQTLFFQLYKHNDEIAEKLVREIEELGYKAIFLTVDALVAGNRERDIRCPWILEDEENGGPTEFYVEGIAPSKEVDMLGTAGALISNIDRDMTWDKAGTPCARRDFVSDLFIIDHSLATKDIQTSHRYQRFVFGS